MSNATELTTTPDTPAADLPLVRPAVDIFENDDGYLIRADVPGATQETIDVRFDQGELVLEAKRPRGDNGTPLGSEFGPADFRRSFQIPQKVDGDKISAKLRKGVLEVELPKAAEVKPRKIAVDVS